MSREDRVTLLIWCVKTNVKKAMHNLTVLPREHLQRCTSRFTHDPAYPKQSCLGSTYKEFTSFPITAVCLTHNPTPGLYF